MRGNNRTMEISYFYYSIEITYMNVYLPTSLAFLSKASHGARLGVGGGGGGVSFKLPSH